MADMTARPRMHASFHDQQRRLAYALLAPAALVVLALIVYPLWQVVDISFREGRTMNFARIREQSLGLGNYARVLTDPAFWRSTHVSAAYVGGTVLASFAIGLGTALLLDRGLPGTRWLRTLVLLPWAVPGVIVSIMFLWIMDGSFGVFNAILRDLGLMQGSHAWFGGDITGRVTSIETPGSSTHLEIDTPAGPLAAVLHERLSLQVGDAVTVAAAPGDLHLFDRDGARIGL